MAPQEIGRVVHFTPGRLRLRVERARRTPAVYEDLRRLLSTLPGVTGVDVTPATGSVLVTYDPNMLDVAHLLHLGAELGWIAPNGQTAQPSIADWRSYVDVPRARRALTFLGVAGLGALLGPAVGVGSRVGSISASIGYLALTRWAKSVGRGGRSRR
jgi:copper chaperone CopZ